jgi:hypothetical protein
MSEQAIQCDGLIVSSCQTTTSRRIPRRLMSTHGLRLRRYLPRLGPRDRVALEGIVEPELPRWGAEGWAFIGRPPRLRVAILVIKKLAETDTPVDSIPLPKSLGGGRLKPAVRALHRYDAAYTSGEASALQAGAGVDYLAPGVPIACNGDRIGLGAVLAIGHQPHIVTCGHAIGSNGTLTTADGDTEIASLRINCFVLADRLDAAVFAVNEVGRTLLHRGSLAPSWCTTVHDPVPTDHDAKVTFWPTWKDHQPAFVEEVLSFASCIPSGIGCNYVMLTRCTNPGDSGSSLQIGASYYALASRRDGNLSFFTPIAAVINRLRTGGVDVTPWSPQ